MDNEGSINDLEGDQIMLLRVFGHLGVEREQGVGTEHWSAIV